MVYLQCPGFLAQYFRKLEWLLLYTHYEELLKLNDVTVVEYNEPPNFSQKLQ